MIAEAPVAAASSVAGMFDKVRAYIATAQSAAADGLTWAEFGELLLALLRLVVPALEGVRLMSGAEKKAFALDAVGRLFDATADYAIPVAAYPLWVLARPAVRALVLAIAGGVLEQYLAFLRGR